MLLWQSLLANDFFKKYLFVCFWQSWVLVAVLRLSLGVASWATLRYSAVLILVASVLAEHPRL